MKVGCEGRGRSPIRMEQTVVFEEKVSLSPLDIRGEITSFDDILLKKLKANLEGKCSKHGYVIRDSLQLLSRSLGMFEKGRFTGDALFWMKAQGKVYNPPDGFQIEGEVIRKNKMGIYVSYKDAIRVIIPRDLHIGDEAFESIEIGEKVEVEIKKSRFQVNDPYVLSVGAFRSSKGKGKGTVEPIAGAEPEPEPEAEALEAAEDLSNDEQPVEIE
jgi:DNA-directed RNA polymerase subunit E'/Rpb7